MEKCGFVETEPLGKNQAFGKRQAIEPENKIDGKLCAAAVADLADVEASGKQGIKNGRGGLCDRRIAADQPNAVALTHLRARPRDRGFEEAQLLCHARAERG